MEPVSLRVVMEAVGGDTHSVEGLANIVGASDRPLSVRQLIRTALRWRVINQQVIRHIFVLMLENRSFDHMFGYSGISGIDAHTGQPTAVNGLTGQDYSNRCQPNLGTNVLTSQSSPPRYKFSMVDGDPPHEFEDVLVQLCGPSDFLVDGKLLDGKYPAVKPPNDTGFVASYQQVGPETPERVMQGFGAADLPALHTLASEFAILDRWFASMPGPTWPNRFFVHAASSAGLDNSPDVWHVVKSGALEVDRYQFDHGTIYDLLYSKGLKFRIYHGDEFPVVAAIRPKSGAFEIDDYFHDFASFQTALDATYDAAFTFIEPNYGAVIPHSTFEGGNSMHPIDDVRSGESLIKTVYEAIRASPLWNSSMLLIVCDEHGGFFDHVTPPPAPSPGDKPGDDDYNMHGFRFDQYGVRVPAIVISPWVAKNVIDHRLYDHSSVPATLERLFGLPPLTNRDAAATDLLDLVTELKPRTDTPATLPEPLFAHPTNPPPATEKPSNPTKPPTQQAFAGKGPGVRAAELSGKYLRNRTLLALYRHQTKLPKEQRPAAIARVASLKTEAEMRSYILEVSQLFAAEKRAP
jgi:phospholipase C